MKTMLLVHDSIGDSIVDEHDSKKLSDLPLGLRKILFDCFSELNFLDIKKIYYNNDLILLEGKHIYSEKMMIGRSKKDLNEAVGLLLWYLRPHFNSANPGVIGAPILCSDCNFIQQSKFGSKCDNEFCSSHDKWEKVDFDYERPKKTSEAFRKFIKVKRNKKK